MQNTRFSNPKAVRLNLFKHTNLVILVGAFLLAGCVAPIPVYEDPPFAEPEKSIEIGQTTRKDVLNLLGAPAVVRRNEQLFAYTDFQAKIQLFVAGPGSAGVFVFGEQHLLAITFDRNGVVQDVELATKSAMKRDVGLTQTTHCISSGECFVSGQQEIAVLANAAEDREAKSFAAAPDVCTVYLYSEDEIDFSVILDKRIKLSTFDGAYFKWNLKPGPHLITHHQPEIVKFDFGCDAGENLYVRFSVPGWFQSPKFDLMPAAEGQAGIRSRKLVLDDI